MIQSITICSNTASFLETQEIDNLSKFNYFFGGNGTGKTTISRVIANPNAYPNCEVVWHNDPHPEAMVYNRDFIEQNFADLKGIFTLGQTQIGTEDKIRETKKNNEQLQVKIEHLNLTLSKKRQELENLEDGNRKQCWNQMKKYDDVFRSIFDGYHNSKEKFQFRVLHEYEQNTTTSIPSQQKLENKYKEIYSSDLITFLPIEIPDSAKLISHESNAILKKHVIGKKDVSIAVMIDKLQNSDWVRQGKAFFDQNNNVCPFCQQTTTDSFALSLEEYFDESFTNDIQEIDFLIKKYETDSTSFKKAIEDILDQPAAKFINIDLLSIKILPLESDIAHNLGLLHEKKKESSREFELKPLGEIIAGIVSILEDGNAKIQQHNKLVANIESERSLLNNQIWKFIVNELHYELENYIESKNDYVNAIQNIERNIRDCGAEITKNESEIHKLEKQITSIKPTIEAMNQLLTSFGFQGFTFAEGDDAAHYVLIRPNGTEAKDTLSEGEKSFVTFIYFYHLLKGSHKSEGLTNDRVVVIDDPVSSLDSEVLFVVSNLIRYLIEEVRFGKGQIKQLFILTHNIYFHKEVTFNSKRSEDNAMNEETFWIIRKSSASSQIRNDKKNPVTTSYKMLWNELKCEGHSSLSIQNVMRRIFENYFKILGGIDRDAIIEKFPENEKVLCNAFFSWANDGSHFAGDDIFVANDIPVDKYKIVFKSIFDKMGHIAHYNMMMGEPSTN